MKRRRKIKRNLNSIVIFLLLTALAAVIVAMRINVKPEKKYTIAVITKSTKSDFFAAIKAGANAAATEYNVKMTFSGPGTEEDFETQNRLIAEAVEDGADAIVISAVDYNASAKAVKRADEAGVKVIVIDSDVNSNAVACRIGTNDYDAGIMAGEAALNVNEEELYIGIVNYNVNSANGQAREAGFRERVSSDSRVKSVETINVLSTTEDAREKTKMFLRRDAKINVVATFNEWTSLGVGWAIRDLNMKEKHVVAFDNNVVSIGMLESGEIDALIVQNPYAMGYLGLEKAYYLLRDGKKPKDMDTETTVITRENMFSPECQKILFSFQ